MKTGFIKSLRISWVTIRQPSRSESLLQVRLIRPSGSTTKLVDAQENLKLLKLLHANTQSERAENEKRFLFVSF